MIVEEEGVVYATAGEADLELDVIRPVESDKATAILFLHGGEWRSGSRKAMRPVARALARRGFTGLCVQYRLTPEAPWPTQIQDVKAAICWTRANADRLEIEPDRIALYGTGSGGHLALLAAGTANHPAFDPRSGISNAVAAVVAVHAPTSLYMRGERPAHASDASVLLGKAATLTRAQAASPTTYVNRDFPPCLLLHGGADGAVDPAASRMMYDALCAAGAPADLHLFHGLGHGFAERADLAPLVEAEAALFLQRTVVDAAARETDDIRLAANAAAGRRAASGF